MLGAVATDIPGNLTYSLNYLGGVKTYLSFGGAVNLYWVMTGTGSFYPQLLWE